jgi:hypothetical protein
VAQGRAAGSDEGCWERPRFVRDGKTECIGEKYLGIEEIWGKAVGPCVLDFKTYEYSCREGRKWPIQRERRVAVWFGAADDTPNCRLGLGRVTERQGVKVVGKDWLQRLSQASPTCEAKEEKTSRNEW